MHTKRFLVFFVVVSILSVSLAAYGQASKAEDEILASAESFFKDLKDRDYTAAWGFLTEKSRETIVKDVVKAVEKAGGNARGEGVARDFGSGGKMATAYWNSFLVNFDPDMALEECRWEMGKIGKEKAEILMTYKKAETPARLRMFSEGGRWKVGLIESFWVRKRWFKQ